jgi:hypothetical protein
MAIALERGRAVQQHALVSALALTAIGVFLM